MKYLFIIFILLACISAASANAPCSDTGGEIRSFYINLTVPFERENNELMVLADYHEWFGLKVYVNDLHYKFSLFPVTGREMSIRLWTQCDINRVYTALVDTDGKESVPSNEVIIDYTHPKTGVIECQ